MKVRSLLKTVRYMFRKGTATVGLTPASPYLPAFLAQSRDTIEAESRRGQQTAYLGNQRVLSRVLGKYLVFADTGDIGITPHLCLNGFWETWITQAVARTVRPGWNCVDVGANHGYYTLLMADAVGPSGRVIACEPNPPVAELLEQTMHVNGFWHRVQIVREPVADVDGASAVLTVPRGFGMNATIAVAGADGSIPMKTITLDTLCRPLGRVDFMKIDAEGAEERIWQGMQRTLQDNPSIIVLLEYNAGRYADPRAFLHAIQGNGFALAHVDYDAQIRRLTPDQVLAERPREDWMLWLQRD